MPRVETDIWLPYRDRGLRVVALASSYTDPETPEAIAAFVEDMGLTMPVAHDLTGEVYEDWHIDDPESFSPYPRQYIIGPDGRFLYLSATIDVEAVRQVVEAALP